MADTTTPAPLPSEPTANPEPDLDLLAQQILLASAQHDLPQLRTLLRNANPGSANVQDPETGFTPLHAAIAACEGPDDARNVTTNGASETAEEEDEVEQAQKTVRLLLQNGAIWNDLDKNGQTPGCIAHRLGPRMKDVYELMVDAGVRSVYPIYTRHTEERNVDVVGVCVTSQG